MARIKPEQPHLSLTAMWPVKSNHLLMFFSYVFTSIGQKLFLVHSKSTRWSYGAKFYSYRSQYSNPQWTTRSNQKDPLSTKCLSMLIPCHVLSVANVLPDKQNNYLPWEEHCHIVVMVFPGSSSNQC